MNLDKLIKLVKLANNNPNEHEANLAARKVCKMIAEANYKFVEPAPQQQRPTTYNDITRSQEPMWSSKPPTGSGFNPFQEEFFKNYRGPRSWENEPPRYEPKKPREDRTKLKRRCSKCGDIVETTNTEVDYVCGTCQWKIYMGGR